MKILAIGDTHGDEDNLSNLMDIAQSRECEKIFQVGDFGYLPGIAKFDSFLNRCSTEVQRTGIPIHWLRGNHDNCEVLGKLGSGIHEIKPGVFYHADGAQWEWNETKFLAVGGAHTPPNFMKVEGENWWRGERTPSSILYGDIADIDIIFYHDAPLSSKIDDLLDFEMEEETITNRTLIQEVCEIARPSLVVHGHYHKRHTGSGVFSDGTLFTVRSLAANKQMLDDQFTILHI